MDVRRDEKWATSERERGAAFFAEGGGGAEGRKERRGAGTDVEVDAIGGAGGGGMKGEACRGVVVDEEAVEVEAAGGFPFNSALRLSIKVFPPVGFDPNPPRFGSSFVEEGAVFEVESKVEVDLLNIAIPTFFLAPIPIPPPIPTLPLLPIPPPPLLAPNPLGANPREEAAASSAGSTTGSSVSCGFEGFVGFKPGTGAK